MWNSLRSDLKEFAASVASDGNAVIEKINDNISKDSSQHDQDSTTTSTNNNNNNNEQQYNALMTIDPEFAHSADADGKTLHSLQQEQQQNEVSNKAQIAILQEAQEEAFRRMDMEVTFLTPLLDSEINGTQNINRNDHQIDKHIENNIDKKIDNNVDNSINESCNEGKDGGDHEQQSVQVGVVTEAEVTSITQTNQSSVDQNNNKDDDDGNDDDDDDELQIKQFIKTFDVKSKTDNITLLLADPDYSSLAQYFETLVPVQVTYEQFWQRYYYRCDPYRIVKEWEEEDKQATLRRQELIGKGVKSVQNIFGGALNAIKGVGATVSQGTKITGAEASSSIYQKYQAELEEKQKAMFHTATSTATANDQGKEYEKRGLFGNALGMFNNQGRPPFVLNTIVDSDGEVEDQVYENEEEEEDDDLGWGSDDDDDDKDYEEEGDNDDETYEGADTTIDSEHEIIIFEDGNTNSNNVIAEIENLKKLLEAAQDAQYKAESKAQALEKELIGVKEELNYVRAQLTNSISDKVDRNEEDKSMPKVLGEDAEPELVTQEVYDDCIGKSETTKEEEEKTTISVQDGSGSSMSSAVVLPCVEDAVEQKCGAPKCSDDNEEDGWGDSWSDEE